MDTKQIDIGACLSSARQTRGLSLRDVAERTKISVAALNAIEHNQFARLPGGVWRQAYVRAFADEVGLDADTLTRAYKTRFEPESPAGLRRHHQADGRDGKRARLAAMTLAVAVMIIAIGGLLLRMQSEHPNGTPDGVEILHDTGQR